MALINLRSLGVTLGAPLFSNLNLAIEPGDRLGIVAANGRGKSTLLRCIAGMLRADIRRNHAGARACASAMSSRMCRPASCDLTFRRRGPRGTAGGAGRKSKAGASMSCWIRWTCRKRCANGRCPR